MNPAQYSALLSSATGQLTGIGVELEVLVPSTTSAVRGTTVVARTEDGSPAQEAGLLRGDIILNVDGTPADKLSPEEIAALSRSIYIRMYVCMYILDFLPSTAYIYWYPFNCEEERKARKPVTKWLEEIR